MKSGNNGRPHLFNDVAITMALMVKCVFSMSLRGLQGAINAVLKLLNYHCYALTVHALASELKRLTLRSRRIIKEASST